MDIIAATPIMMVPINQNDQSELFVDETVDKETAVYITDQMMAHCDRIYDADERGIVDS